MTDMSSRARQVLGAARNTSVPASSKARVRRAVAASIASGVTGASIEAAIAGVATLGKAGALGGSHSLLTALALWGAGGFAAGATALTVGVAVMRPAPPRSPPMKPTAAAAPSHPTSIPTTPLGRTPPVSTQPKVGSAPEAVNRGRRAGVGDELRLLSEARAALRDGDPGRALWLTGQHEQRFSAGALMEEALTTKILALCALGRREQGRAAIGALERLAPQSPGLPRVRAACEENP